MPRLAIPEKTPEVLSPGLRPDAIIMRSGMGESVFVPKAKYEEFERYLSNKSALPMGSTSETIDRLAVDVNLTGATDSSAQVKVNAHATLLESNSNWLSLPIAMGGIQPVPTPVAGGNFEFPPLRVASDNTGYVWRVAPGELGNRELSFDALAKVRTLSQGHSLRLELPSVNTTVRLALPLGLWELNVAGNGSEVTEAFQDIGQSSVSTVRTSGGTLTLTWTKKVVAEQVQAIEVESFTKYSAMIEPGEFRAAARLAIRGPKMLGGRRFLVSLPPRSVWREPMSTEISYSGYRLGRYEGAVEGTDVVLLLEFEEAFSRTEMELQVDWQTKSQPDSDWADFAMVRVEGVQRHVGSLDISIPRNVSLRWDPQTNFQFTRQSQASDGSDSLNYSFRFHQQAEPLRVRLNIGDRASDLKGNYHVAVDSTILRLNGSIDILGDVRSLPFLQLDVRGWSVERVQLQPSGRDLDLAAIRSRSAAGSAEPENEAKQTTTSIPLSLGELLDALPSKNGPAGTGRPTADAMALSAESSLPNLSGREDLVRQPTRSISFVLSRPSVLKTNAETSKKPFEFSLPMLSWLDQETQLRQSMSIGGELTIQSSSTDLAPLELVSETFHLIQEPTTTLRRSTIKYRVDKAESWVQWTGTSESFGANIEAASRTRVTLTREEIDLTQTWRLVCLSNPIPTLRVALPKDWIEEDGASNGSRGTSSTYRISVDNIPVALTKSHDDWDASSLPFVSASFPQRYTWFQIELPGSERKDVSQHERTLVIQKKRKVAGASSSLEIPMDLSLPWIAANNASDSLVVSKCDGDVVHDGNMECVIQAPTGGAEKEERRGESDTAVITFDRTNWEPRLIGELRLLTEPNWSEVALESVWLQTIVNAIQQRDRYVARFKTRSKSISLKLPSLSLATAEFIVNHRKVVPIEKELHLVEIPLGSSDQVEKHPEEKTYVLEVFVWSTNKAQWLKKLQAEPLTIAHASTRAPFAWQVIVPTTVHVIGNTSTLTPGYRWKWQDLWYGRTSEWNQESLGKMMGATIQPFVDQPTNQYVYFSLDHSAPMSVSTLPRFLLWAPVALFVLIGSFFIMEFRWIRRPWIMVVLVLSGLAFSQWAWDLSIALVQCLVVAIAIAAMYSVLKWVVDRRARRRSVFASRPSSPLIVSAGRSNGPSGSAVLVKPALAPAAVLMSEAKDPSPSTTHTPDDGGL